MKIHKGDTVKMSSGKDRGKTGKVLRVSPTDRKLVVEGLNLVKRHLRPRRQGQKGQIIAKERFVHVSAVALVCPSCGKPTRVGYQVGPGGGSKQRFCKKCKAPIA